MYKKIGKRLIDLVISIIGLPFFGIIFIIFAPIIKLTDNGPVFYNAERLGWKGKVYKMYKFRSMRVNAPDIRNADGSTYNGDDDPRVTKIGRIMRKTSVDETPQILNVLKGDMSIIGPRPFVTTHYEGYDKLDEKRKKRLDVSLGLDVKIFFQTIRSVLKRENIYVDSAERKKSASTQKRAAGRSIRRILRTR